MKSIENVSSLLEEILVSGLKKADSFLEIELFQASIKLYYYENTVFVLYSKIDTYTKKNIVAFFEIKNTESYFLFSTINQVLDDLDRFGEEQKRKETLELYSKVISYCNQISFGCTDFETAIKKMY